VLKEIAASRDFLGGLAAFVSRPAYINRGQRGRLSRRLTGLENRTQLTQHVTKYLALIARLISVPLVLVISQCGTL